MLLIPIQTLVFVIPLVMTVSARGYDETSAHLGVESLGGNSSMHFSYNSILQLDGIAFGNNPAKSFATWAESVTCTLSGGSTYSGFACVDSAIKSASFTAAEGVRSSTSDLENTIALSGAKNQQGAYNGGDLGQGSSCTQPATYAAQPDTCPSTVYNGVPLASGNYTFPTRGIKVTCKAACGQSSPLDQDNWNQIIGKLTSFLSANNYYAARFTVSRLTTNTVVARCRVTSPNIGQFGIDICPDQIPHAGKTVLAGDSSLA
ncbi:hypothetical protein G7054_g10737 [Neopestalotiopsis clavispora]|nr:hypothetical protein G7054_g10737 [Neopestalotiopsis clavispora]